MFKLHTKEGTGAMNKTAVGRMRHQAERSVYESQWQKSKAGAKMRKKPTELENREQAGSNRNGGWSTGQRRDPAEPSRLP